jgi:hypothetical protein
MERRHDLGNSGPTKVQIPSPSGGQRVPTGAPSTPQHAHDVAPRKPQVFGSKMTAPSDVGNSKERRVSLRATRNTLIVLATLLGLWLVIALGRSPNPTPSHENAGSAAVKDQRGLSIKAGTLPGLKVALITLHEPYVPAAVSLFSVPPPPPPPPVVATQPAAPPPPAPPDPFVEAAKQLRFVGFLKSDATVAAIITQGTQLYIASRGDTVAERFRVASVHEDTVTLASPEGDKQVQLALAAAAGASPVAMANPSVEGGRAEGESAGEVAARSEPATAKPKPIAGPVILSRTERSEMYRVRAQTVQP